MTNPNPFVAFLAKYQFDPERYVREVLGVNPDAWQVEVLRVYGAMLRREHPKRRISVRSCNGPGKTALAAWCANHHADCFYPQKTAVLAPSGGQAEDALGAEIKKWFGAKPADLRRLFVIKADRIEHVADEGYPAAAQESFIVMKTARKEQPEALQGLHSARMLAIFDEDSGVPESVHVAGAGFMSDRNAITILISNPTQTTGTFFDSHNKLSDLYATFHVSWADSPRVSKEFEAEMRLLYGERSNEYEVYVLGNFPKQDEFGLIPWALVDAAKKRDVVVSPAAPRVWGVDPARFGPDASTLCIRAGSKVLQPTTIWHGLNTMELSGALVALRDDTPPDLRPREILVDAIGIGAGVVDRLGELGLPVRGINVGEAPSIRPDRYTNLRADLWHECLRWFETRAVSIPAEDRNLSEELTAVRYKYHSSGKRAMELKEETKARLRPKRSPGSADALVLTFASDYATLAGVAGGPGRPPWNEPLIRGLKGIV